MTKLGIIAEDKSDIDTLLNFIQRITDAKFKKKRYATQGSGRLQNKCQKIINRWLSEKVTHVIVCRDLDRNDYDKLYSDLRKKTSSFPNYKNVVCIVIPIEEMEAWFLSDISSLNAKFIGINLKEIPHPETIKSPKEYIEKKSHIRCRPRYIHKIHNPELAKLVDVSKVRNKCPEFEKFYKFVSKIKSK